MEASGRERFHEPDPQTPAKVTRPHLEGVIPRERLFHQIDEGRRRPVLWVSGPGGSGKTTLVSSYIESRQVPSLWYQVDRGDTDPATFFHYLGLATKTASPRWRRPLPVLTPDFLLAVPGFGRNFFEEVFRRLPSPGLLVFDDCQLVDDDAPMFGVLLDVLNRLPEGLTLLLVSRSHPPAAFARLQANRQLATLNSKDLRFTPPEFEELATSHGVEPGRGSLRSLYHTASGWVAGLTLLVEHVRSIGEVPAAAELGTPESLFDYFSREVFDHLPSERQDFLLKTSFLPDVTAGIAAELTENPGAAHVLSAFHRQNFFTDKHAQHSPVYQYHPLFRRFLNNRAREVFSDEALRDVQSAASTLLAAAGRHEPAAALAVGAQDWEGLIRLVLEQAPGLLSRGRLGTVEGWLRSFPPQVLEATPWLLYWLGVCRLPHAPTEAQNHFERAFTLFQEHPDGSPGDKLALAGVVQAIHLAFTDLNQLDPWLERVPLVVGPPAGLPPGPIGARVACAIFSAMVAHDPAASEIDAWEAAALALAETTDDLLSKVHTYFHSVFRAVYSGRAGAIAGGLEGIRKAVRGVPSPAPFVLLIEKFAACYDHLLVKRAPDAAAGTIDEAIELATESGVHLVDIMLLGTGAMAAQVGGDLPRFGRYLEQMEALSPGLRRWEQAFLRGFQGRRALASGDLSAATEYCREAAALAVEAGVPTIAAFCRGLLAVVAAERGDHDQALSMVLGAKEELCRLGAVSCVVDAELCEAKIHLVSGDAKKGRAVLASALKAGRDRGCPGAWFCPAHWLEALFLEALNQRIEVDYVRELISVGNVTPANPPVDCEAWPWPLRIYTLGRFEIVRDDKPLRARGKTQQRPLALLKTLLSFGGREVTEAQLSSALWPDAEGDAAQQAFRVTLHRLRKLLGVGEALDYSNGRLTLDARHCWVDVWAMERALGAAEAGGANLGPAGNEQVIEWAARGCNLYRGAFLRGDVDPPVTIQMRGRLQRRFLRGIETLGKTLEDSGRCEGAIQRYLRGLEVDPLLELFYQRLMVCYRTVGRNAEALATYEQCRRRLARALRTSPSERTEQLRREIEGIPPS